MNAIRESALLVVGLTFSFGAWAQPSNLENARLEVRSVQPGQFHREVGRAVAESGSHWVGYAVPAIEGNFHDDRRCHSLESDLDCTRNSNAPRQRLLDSTGQLLVFVRASDGSVDRVRSFSDGCPIDAQSRRVIWLTPVNPDESLTFLTSLLHPADSSSSIKGTKQSDDGGITAAVALHAGSGADRALKDLMGKDQALKVREHAAFWLGVARGRAGFETLKSLVPSDEDAKFRRNATFAISQSRDAEAVPTLIGMARHDKDAGVRGQALFWLAQKAERKASEAVSNAIEDDPDTDVKKKAVFALTQLPQEESVPKLIRVATQNKNREVRKAAMFWIGQSRDPRAIDFIEQLLTH